MTNLRSTAPHFVRCIIPNETKTPGTESLLSVCISVLPSALNCLFLLVLNLNAI